MLIEETETNKQTLEDINTNIVLEMATHARQKTWDSLEKISQMIHPGMTEKEAIKAANSYFKDQGVRKYWHQTHVRFGKSTILSFNDQYHDNVVLGENDIFYIDVGPVWDKVESDCGNTFVVGNNSEHLKIKEDLKRIFDDVQEYWRKHSATGAELCDYAKTLINTFGYKMHPSYVKGHRLSEFSHARYGNTCLFDLPFNPASERWVMELQIAHPSMEFGAFYEDLLI